MIRAAAVWLGLLIILLISGCARYEFVLIERDGSQATISGEQDMVVDRPPLRYALADLDHRVGIAIINDTPRLVQLRDAGSYVVDPLGETHPIPPRMIAPHSHATLVIPPARQRYRIWSEPGPYGSPYWAWDYSGRLRHYDPYWWDPYPMAYDIYAPPTPQDWVWEEGPARVHLEYDVRPEEIPPDAATGPAEPIEPATMPATVPDDAPAPAATEESFAHELLLERRRVD